MARTAKRYKKNTEKKIPGILVCMAAIYARLSVDNDEKKSESIETQVTLIKVCFRGITTEQPPPTTATYHDRKSRKGFLFFCAKKRADFPALSKSFLKKFPKTLPYLHFSA